MSHLQHQHVVFVSEGSAQAVASCSLITPKLRYTEGLQPTQPSQGESSEKHIFSEEIAKIVNIVYNVSSLAITNNNVLSLAITNNNVLSLAITNNNVLSLVITNNNVLSLAFA